MRNGLKILRLPAGYYGYPVTRCGWLRRVSGDEFELIGGRTMARKGPADMGGLEWAAANGPSKYTLSPSDEMPEEIHRLLLRRALVCKATHAEWVKACPKPRGWVDE